MYSAISSTPKKSWADTSVRPAFVVGALSAAPKISVIALRARVVVSVLSVAHAFAAGQSAPFATEGAIPLCASEGNCVAGFASDMLDAT